MPGMVNVVLLLWFLASTVHGSTVYMVTFPSQLDTNGDQYTIHIVGKPGATVTIETPHHPPGGSILNLGVTGHYKGAVSRTLYYLQINLFDLQTKGVRISSDDDFAVSIIYGQDKHPASAGGYSAIPVPVLEDPSFIIVTYDQSGSSFVYFAIASSEDNITVSINVKTDDSVRFRNNDYFDGDTLELTLQKLQVLQLESKRDLTGTVIRSNGPVTVFAGIVCAAIPLGEIFCDNILEQLPSVDLWGYRYLGAPLLGRTGGTVLRAVAAYRNTTIERVSDGNIFNLQSGDVLEWEMVSEGDDIRSTKPILVVQFSKSYSVNSSGGSAMMVLRAVEYYSPKFYIIAADEFETYVNILINTADNSTLLFDGNIIAFTSEMFLEGVESLFRFAVSEGIHVIQSTNFSAVFDVVVYGYRQGQGISYQALSSIPDQTTDTTTTSVTAASPLTETESLAASTLSSAASSMSLSTSSSTSVTDSGTDPLTYTTAADDSSFVVVHPESSLDTGQAIAMDTATPWPSSLSSSAADASLTTSDTIEITTTEATSPTTSSSSSSAVSASDVLVFSSAVLDTTSAVDSSSVSPSTSSPVNSDSGAESATPIGSTAISSTNALSTHESLESSGTAPSSSTASPPADGTPAADATQSPDSTASLSHPAALFLNVSYSPYNAPSLWFSSQSTTSDNLSRLVISSGTAYELELVTSPNIGSITPSSVSSETDTTTTSVTAASPLTETESLAASTLSSAASSMSLSTSSSTSVTDSGTDPLTYTTAADDSSFVVVHPESSLDTGQAIAMDTATPWPSSLSSSAADASLTTSDTIEITTTEATSPTTSSSSSSAVSASDVLVFSSAVLDTTSAVDSSSVSPSTSSPVNSDSGAESATPIGSTAISSRFALSTHESLESSGTAPSSSTASPPADGTPAADATQSPDSTASLSHPAALFLNVSYSPYNAPSLWFSSQSTTSDNLSRLVTSSGTAYELELVTSPNIGSITTSSVSSETGPSTAPTTQVIPTTGVLKTTKRSQHRRCHCAQRMLMSLNVTSMEFQQMLMATKKNLSLSHQRLSSYIRSKTSAQDHRPTAQNVGYVGIAMLSTVVALLFCGDVVTLLKRLF